MQLLLGKENDEINMSGIVCILCQNNESVLVKVGVRLNSNLEVRRCADCGLVFSWPRPTEKELERYYVGSYRSDSTKLSMYERYRIDLNEAHVRVGRLLPFLQSKSRLLEIGCGSGAFLGAVSPYVAEVWGLELDAEMRNWIKEQMGITVMQRLNDIPQRYFDFVMLFHVLEHVREPVSFLQSLSQLLSPDGRLIVEVPNIDDVLVAVYRVPAYLHFYYQKAHLYYFSKDSLIRTFNQAGFDVVIEGIQRYDLSNHIRWMLTGQPGGQGYYKDIFSPSVYADALIRAGHSDTLWAITKVDSGG